MAKRFTNLQVDPIMKRVYVGWNEEATPENPGPRAGIIEFCAVLPPPQPDPPGFGPDERVKMTPQQVALLTSLTKMVQDHLDKLP